MIFQNVNRAFIYILNERDSFIFLVSCLLKGLFFTYPPEMEVSDSKLRNEMHYEIKVGYLLGKIAPETIKLMKDSYKNKCSGESMVFTSNGDFQKGCLSEELTSKIGRTEL